MPTIPVPDASSLAEAMRLWHSGQQEPAKALVQPIAMAGMPAANLIMAWFLHQQGEPAWREAVPFAKVAVENGFPQAAGYVVGNMLNDPNLRAAAIEIASAAAAQGVVVLDPIGQAAQFAQQNDEANFAAVISHSWPGMFPKTPEGWSELVSAAREHSGAIAAAARDVGTKSELLLTEWEQLQSRIKAQSTQLMSFITQTTNAEASKFFESEATSSRGEAETTWKFGVGVVLAATAISLMPLIGHYFRLAFDHGPKFNETQILSAHVAGALALGTLAGVLLTRSRVRDRNRQRNTDLAVALKMLFAYAQQIENEAERQAFVQANGRLVLEAYLRQDGGPTEEGQGGILAR